MTAKILTTVFVGLVAFAFIFTFDAPQNIVGGGSLAKVEGYKILPKEFQREYDFQLKLLSFRMGGKSLTNKQIEEFRVRGRALQVAIEKKLFLLLAEGSGIRSGPASIRQEVRGYDFFQTDGEFDLIKYRDLLQANSLTPVSYEKIVVSDLMARQGEQLSSYAPVSKSFTQDVLGVRKVKRRVSVVQVKDAEMKKFVKVSSNEVDKFLLGKEGKSAVDNLFALKKESLKKKVQVRARHILFKGDDSLKKAQDVIEKKITKDNFAFYAKKYSEDSTKSKGGDLGWFGPGRMVPDFERVAFSLDKGTVSKPVKTSFGHHLILVTGRKEEVPAKIEDYERDLAKELIRKEKADQVVKLREKVAREFMDARGKKSWEKISKKYALSPTMDRSISLLDDRIGLVTLSPQDREKIFFGPKKNTFMGQGGGGMSVVFQVLGKEIKEVASKGKEKEPSTQSDFEQELKRQRDSVASQLKDAWLAQLWERSSISCQGIDIKDRQSVFKCKI